MRATRCIPLLLLAAALGLSGCYTRARGRTTFGASVSVPSEVVITSRTDPPPVRRPVAQRPRRPGPDAVWVHGHYKWQGGQWVWVRGHWERDRRGYVWVAPVAERRGGRLVYHPGYWRRESQQPPRVYRRPGAVRVSVRPSEPVRVRSPQGRRGDATVRRPRDAGPTRVERPEGRRGGSATVRRPEGRQGGGATVRRPEGRQGGGATVRRPEGRQGGGATVRRPEGRQGGTATTRRRSGSSGSARVRRPSGRQPNRADDSVARARRSEDRVQGEDSRRAPTHRPSQNPHAEDDSRAPTHRPSQNPRTEDGSEPGRRAPTVTARNPNVRDDQTPDDVRRRSGDQRPPLTCSLGASRAPEGGLVTISGTFSSRARVQIGGQFAPVVRRGRGRVRVRVPGSSGGGTVRVLDGDGRATCGTLTVQNR